MGKRHPIKWKSRRRLQNAVDEYFKLCDNNKKPYTVSGLSLHLNIVNQTLLKYAENYIQFEEIVQTALLKCENYAEENLYTAKNPLGLMFALKNRWKWKDRMDMTTDDEKIQSKTYVGNLIAGINIDKLGDLNEKELAKLAAKQIEEYKFKNDA